MSYPRTLLLFDERAQPSSWNERMTAGEYAVHYSGFDGSQGTGPECSVFGSLAEAEDYARRHVLEKPSIRCRIYDHHGLIGPPIREIGGSRYKGESEISPRFRRWAGSLLFFGGLILVLVDWNQDFRLSWPAMIGMRMLFPGLLLLITEAFLLYAKRKDQHTREGRVV